MEGDKESKTSNIFLVRLWMDDGVGEDNWHGKVQHIASGKAASFSSQASMIQLLASMFTPSRKANAPRREGAGETDPFGPESPSEPS